MQVSFNAPYQVTVNTYTDPTDKQKDTLQTSDENKESSTEIKKDASKENQLSDEEKRSVSELQARDTEVRAHEAAHQAAGGGLTGGASYTYQKGPDGRMYAIGGEVSIATKGGSTPQETLSNARQVQAAAMAPANPSGQDYAVATSAKVLEMKAQQELAKEQQAQMRGEKEYGASSKQNSNDTTDQEYKPFDISA